jgi:hypothetical protein
MNHVDKLKIFIAVSAAKVAAANVGRKSQRRKCRSTKFSRKPHIFIPGMSQ